MDPDPTIAIVGRPNVGKSTLFNRLTHSRKAITTDIPGTTRDIISSHLQINDYFINLVDTGGLEYGNKSNIEEDVQTQAKIAIEEADIILFVVDGSNELTIDDFTAADILRKSQKDIIFIANKCDSDNIKNQAYGLFELGFGEPLTISAIHKTGIDTLKHLIEKNLKKQGYKPRKKEDVEEKVIEDKDFKPKTAIALLGKPNAGKSSLFNAITGSKKAIISDIPGTTRDSLDTEITYKDKNYTLIDTAGLRRRGKIERGIEKYSSIRSMNSIERAEVVVLMIDGDDGISNQDLHIVQFALENNKGIIIAVNKLDLLENNEQARDMLVYKLRKKFTFIPWAPVVFLSALNKKNIFKVLELADEILEERGKRIETKTLNSFIQQVCLKHPPASTSSKKPKFMYATQPGTYPPRIVLFFRNAKKMHFSYKRYLENEIRKEYGFNGTALDIAIKESVRRDFIT